MTVPLTGLERARLLVHADDLTPQRPTLADTIRKALALAAETPVLVDDHEECSRQMSSVARLAHQVHNDDPSSTWRKCLYQVCIQAQRIEADMFLRTIDAEGEL